MGKPGERARAEILTILRRRGESCSAYDILDDMKKSNPKVAPTTVYRALEVLINQGEVHRLESLNAFIACKCDAHEHPPIMSICDDCGIVEDRTAPDVHAKLSVVLEQSGFMAHHQVVEVHGKCADCGTGQAEV